MLKHYSAKNVFQDSENTLIIFYFSETLTLCDLDCNDNTWEAHIAVRFGQQILGHIQNTVKSPILILKKGILKSPFGILKGDQLHSVILYHGRVSI